TRKTEVQHFYVAIETNHNVGRLEVAMDDADSMRGTKSLEDLPRNPDALLRVRRMFEPIAQGFALYQLGHHIAGTGWQRSDVVECADVGMIQCRYRPRLSFESFAELLRGNLDGDSAS